MGAKPSKIVSPEDNFARRSAASVKAAVTARYNRELAKAGAIRAKVTRVSDPVLDSIVLVTAGADLQAVATALGRLQQMGERMALYRKLLRAAMVEYIEANGGDKKRITIGVVDYWIGRKKKVKCKDVKAFIDAVLTLGSVEQLIDVMSSQPFKQGSVNNTMPALFAEHFTVSYEDEIRDNSGTKKVKDAVAEKAALLQSSRPQGDLPGESEGHEDGTADE